MISFSDEVDPSKTPVPITVPKFLSAKFSKFYATSMDQMYLIGEGAGTLYRLHMSQDAPLAPKQDGKPVKMRLVSACSDGAAWMAKDSANANGQVYRLTQSGCEIVVAVSASLLAAASQQVAFMVETAVAPGPDVLSRLELNTAGNGDGSIGFQSKTKKELPPGVTRVVQISCSSEEDLWLVASTGGASPTYTLYRYDDPVAAADTNGWTKITTPAGKYPFICAKKNGAIWLLTTPVSGGNLIAGNDFIGVYTGQTGVEWDQLTGASTEIEALDTDADGLLWAVTFGGAVLRWNGVEFQKTGWQTTPSAQRGHLHLAVARDEYGGVYGISAGKLVNNLPDAVPLKYEIRDDNYVSGVASLALADDSLIWMRNVSNLLYFWAPAKDHKLVRYPGIATVLSLGRRDIHPPHGKVLKNQVVVTTSATEGQYFHKVWKPVPSGSKLGPITDAFGDEDKIGKLVKNELMAAPSPYQSGTALHGMDENKTPYILVRPNTPSLPAGYANCLGLVHGKPQWNEWFLGELAWVSATALEANPHLGSPVQIAMNLIDYEIIPGQADFILIVTLNSGQGAAAVRYGADYLQTAGPLRICALKTDDFVNDLFTLQAAAGAPDQINLVHCASGRELVGPNATGSVVAEQSQNVGTATLNLGTN